MSTFLGSIEEIPGISVDRFDKKNIESSAFFLSHCHTDHMQGLCNTFWNMLQDRGLFLYCSPISKIILESIYPLVNGKNIIQSLEMCDPVIVNYKGSDNTEFVTVTSIPSGHCLGSVMFLFEKNDQSILYTGDFRILPNDFHKLKPLHVMHGLEFVPKKLHKVYLDTTFLSLDFKRFPSRKESASQICSILQRWLDENSRNVVVLECSGNYGSEFIFKEIAKKLRRKIHVKCSVYVAYSKFESFSRYVTNENMTTPIHACMNKLDRDGLKCRPWTRVENIMTVVPSTMLWKGKDVSKIWQWDQTRNNTLNVCYSMHASYEELVAFLKYFNPNEVYPCVCTEEGNEMYRLLREITKDSEQKIYNEKEYVLSKSLQKSSDVVSFKSQYFSDDED